MMDKMMTKGKVLIIGFLFVCFLFTGIISSSTLAEGFVKYNFPKDNFSIQTPNNWQRIPDDIVKQSVKSLHQVSPQLQSQTFEYGFQLKSRNWLEYPYILIQIKNNGKISTQSLNKLKQINKEDFSKKITEKTGNILSNISFGEIVYDSANQIVWMRFQLTVQGVGNVIGISGMCLTSEGWIQVNCYASEIDYPNYESTFESVIRSVKVADKYKYRG